MPVFDIESMDHEARGIARLDGKTVFVEGALPRERVVASIYRRHPNYERARLERVIRPSSQRVDPACPHFGTCGGCSMQHLDFVAQAAVKGRILEDTLWHVGRVRAEHILPPILGPAWAYRTRARLTVRHVAKKGGVLVGFHERKSTYVTDMNRCPVLPGSVSALLPELRRVVERLSIPTRIPQIEVAVAESGTALVFRHLEPLTPGDHEVLDEFARRHRVQIWLQPKGPDSAHLAHPGDAPALHYTHPESAVRVYFRPTDFTQVNAGVNAMLVRRALALLDPRQGERIADLFCGLGNFTLPIARLGASVVGVEGSVTLIERAEDNAARNGLADRCQFLVADLFQCTPASFLRFGRFDKLLIDPPRDGAIALVKALPEPAPERIVYVSCNPATLARDAAYLHHERRYRLVAAGIANMFPHTSHVESIACFEQERP